uniref:C2H2-type domain-containing protein n=2 Tax=Dendroctonus ponderosae TaxID=77166 RepID=A0AAR5PLP7_DENPD
MGKHLISHYHFSRGDISSPANRQLVLDNILGVVLESPFQCNMCKFYCNTLGQFVAHWRSGAHLAEELKRPDGHFLCDFCRHKAPSSEQMLSHLESAEHLEVAQAINRSVPICIRRLQEIPCSVCWQRFVLNRQLLTHSRLHHPDPMGDEVHQCGRCPKVLGSAISLQQHLRRAHQEPSYFCNTCAMRFKSGEEARKHRLSIQHRYARLDLAKDGRQRRRCQHCGDMFQNFLLLKEHLGLRHPEHKIRCPQCGAQFIIPQELTNHLKNCTFPTGEPSQSSSFSCDRCAYSSNSSAELLFHVALHKAPDPSTRPKLKCPLCERLFPRNSLQAHLRIHTQERPYECKVCYARFARKSNLQNHQKNHERVQAAPRKAATDPDDRAFLCSTCGTGFNRRFTLQQHMLIHSGKINRCPEPGCSYIARKKYELDEHQRIHSSERLYGCDLCEYRSKTKKLLRRHIDVHEGVAGRRYHCSVCSFTTRISGNLRRHARLHTGAKPYQCPYCKFKCNNMGNLRRHVLSTSKHPGKCVYECRFCEGAPPFQTNVAKLFNVHLTCIHADQFSDGPKAASYISGIYEAQEDNTILMEVDNADDPPEEASDRLTTNEDPVVAVPALADAPSQDLPLFVVPENAALAPWSLIGRYDVEESGILVPFQNSDEDDLFQEPF